MVVHSTKKKRSSLSSLVLCWCRPVFLGGAALLGLSTLSIKYNNTFLSSVVSMAETLQNDAAVAVEQEQQVSNNKQHLIVNEYLSFNKVSGDGWELWDRTSVLFNNTNTNTNTNSNSFSCWWITFKGHQKLYQPPPPRGLQIPMCAHPGNDILSILTAKKKKWMDCEALLVWWTAANNDGIYLEIGANIGACLFDVLLGTNATIAAFEPNPKNLFALTSTLVKLDKSYRDRVYLFPVGLGQKAETNVIYAAVDNAGNSVVGKIVKDTNEQKFAEPLPIHIERLDDLIDAKHTRVKLMKLDAQGYECYILDGMPQVLSKVQRIGFEFSDRWQSAFPNCSAKLLVDRLRGHDMSIYQINGSLIEGEVISDQTGEDFSAVRNKN